MLGIFILAGSYILSKGWSGVITHSKKTNNKLDSNKYIDSQGRYTPEFFKDHVYSAEDSYTKGNGWSRKR